jgi:hypothetical protein
MIRFTWLQFRTQGAVAIGALVAVALVAAITGPHLVHLYDTNVATCAAHRDCSSATTLFLRNDSSLRTWLGILAIVAPGVIGIFWGAPLVAREVEAGTFRLAWTQSVTRTRWLAAKLGVIGLASMAMAGLLSLLVTWWASPLDRAHINRFATFDQRDIVAIGYAAFTFALGVTAGVLIRRTLPAMATTLGAFVFARLAMIHWIRPHLIAAAHQTSALDPVSMGYGSTGSGPDNLFPATPHIPNAWIYTTRIVDNAGHALNPQYLKDACPLVGAGPPPGGPAPGSGQSFKTQAPAAAQTALRDCVTKLSATYHQMVTYQPASRYWTFQWYELAIFLGAALILSGGCIWWVRRRLS